MFKNADGVIRKPVIDSYHIYMGAAERLARETGQRCPELPMSAENVCLRGRMCVCRTVVWAR